MGFMALITALVLCAGSQDLVRSVSVRGVHVAIVAFKGGESRVLRRVEPPRCGEASRKPRALSWVQTQAIGALTDDFTD